MKKVIVILCFILGTGLALQAQVHPRAIGLRFGGGSVFGGEISYQQGLSETNRLEFDLGFGGSANYSSLFVSGTYQWNWNITEGLNWYAGPGAAVGFYSRTNDDNKIKSGLTLGVGGQIGLEYDFNHLNAPILLSLDTRPIFDFIGYNDGGFGWGVSLGVRYTWQ